MKSRVRLLRVLLGVNRRKMCGVLLKYVVPYSLLILANGRCGTGDICNSSTISELFHSRCSFIAAQRPSSPIPNLTRKSGTRTTWKRRLFSCHEAEAYLARLFGTGIGWNYQGRSGEEWWWMDYESSERSGKLTGNGFLYRWILSSSPVIRHCHPCPSLPRFSRPTPVHILA